MIKIRAMFFASRPPPSQGIHAFRHAWLGRGMLSRLMILLCVTGMGLLRIRLESSRNKSAAKIVLSHEPIRPVSEHETNYYYTLSETTVKALQALWKDKGVRTAVIRGHEYELNDSAL